MYLCDNCKYFTDKCEHESNIFIKLERRIEKIAYKSLEKKKSCYFYDEIIKSDTRINSNTLSTKTNKNICKNKK